LRTLRAGDLTDAAAVEVQHAIADVVTTTAGVTGLGEAVKTAAAQELPPGQVLAGLWDIMLRGAITAEDHGLDPVLLGQVLQQVQERITRAVPEGALLGGLWQTLAESVTQAERDIDPALMLRYWSDLADRQQQQAFLDYFAHTTGRQRVGNALMEAWINGLLSGPQTHVANAVSNASTIFWAIAERQLAGMLHADVGDHVMRGEAVAMLYGAIEGFQDALRVAGKSFGSGQAEFGGAAKTEIMGAISGEALGLSGVLGHAIDLLGTGINTPGRALLASDEFFKAINYRMELHAQAYRAGVRQGLEGQALTDFLRDTVAHPWESLRQRAEAVAFYQTFNNQLGPTGQAVLAFADSHPAVRLVLPFIRTPTNIFKYGIERMPGLNLTLRSVREDIAAGGARQDLALAKMALGGMVMGTVGVLAASGTITGAGPHDPNLKRILRDTGWQPYSIKIGDTFYSYNRLDPLGNLLGVAASIAELSGELPQAELDQLAMASVLATLESITSKTYLTGLSNAIDAMTRPDEKGVNFLRGMARSIVPAGVAQVNRAFLDKQLHEVHSMLDEIRARLPGFSDDLPPRRNLYGEPIVLPSGIGPDILSPVYTTTATHDPVTEEILAHRVSLSLPGRYLGGRKPPMSPFADRDRAAHGVPLSPAEYDLYVRLAGNEYKSPADGLGMHDKLAQVIASPEYARLSDGPDGSKAVLIRKIVSTYREAAGQELLRRSQAGDGVLFDLYMGRQLERAQQQMPTGGASALSQSLGR